MAFQDRYFDQQRDVYSPLIRAVSGSLPLITVADVRVRVHVSLLLLAAVVLLAESLSNFTIEHRIVFVTSLLAVLIVYELARVVMARAVGGYADQIVLWPLGGLAQVQVYRPGPALAIAAAGPAAALVVATIAAGLLQNLYGSAGPSWNRLLAPGDWTQLQFHLWYLYVTSFGVLLVNLLPIYPLAGGHAVHALLWPVLGYGRAALAACGIGLVAAATVASYGVYQSQWWLVALGLVGALFCVRKRAQVKAAGVASFDEFDAHLRRRHHLSRYTKWKARRQIRREEAELAQLDVILEKIQRRGMRATTWRERRILRRATERQRSMEEVEG